MFRKRKRDKPPQALLRKLSMRCGGECEYCHTLGYPEMHRINRNLGYREDNAIMLCPNCHAEADRGEISMEELSRVCDSIRIVWDALMKHRKNL